MGIYHTYARAHRTYSARKSRIHSLKSIFCFCLSHQHRTCYSNHLCQNVNKMCSFLFFLSSSTNTDLLIHSGRIPGVPLCKNAFTHKVNEKFNFPLLFSPSFVCSIKFCFLLLFPTAMAHLQCITKDRQCVSLECALEYPCLGNRNALFHWQLY